MRCLLIAASLSTGVSAVAQWRNGWHHWGGYSGDSSSSADSGDVVYTTEMATVTMGSSEPTATWDSSPTTTEPASYSSPTQTASSGSSTGPNQYAQDALDTHNAHRSDHSSGAVTWDDDLASSAQSLANQCVFQHQVDGDYGQNIAEGTGDFDIKSVITGQWYTNEEAAFSGLYGQNEPDMSNFDAWGHFTQLVWEGTQKIGCATATCGSGSKRDGGAYGHFTVCNYSPPGNYDNEYAANVKAPSS